ncbi:MAG: ABC transporter permease [Thermosynechococcaceae cyanobacterium]
MQRILVQCRKELAQFSRDRLTLALAFVLPMMTLLIFGFAIRLEAKNIPVAIQDLDNSPLSRSYLEQIFAAQTFQAVPWDGTQPVDMALDRSLAKAAMIIPPDFSQSLAAGRPNIVQVLVDGTDTNNARVIKNSIKAATNVFLQLRHLIPDQLPVVVQSRLWFNPGRQEALYIVPGTYAVVLWIFPSLLSAIAMVREKEQGTIVQVYASRISAAELLLGKLAAYVIVGLGMATAVMGTGVLVFHLTLVGDPTPLLVGTPLFLSVAVMFGLLLGVRAGNQNAAVQGVSLIGFITAFLLSGFIYPLSNIPFPLSVLPNIVPARYYIGITRDAYVRGVGWSGVWFDMLMLGILGFLLFNVARRALSRMQLPD